MVSWNRQAISEGVAQITEALSRAPIGPYQLQAAIAAVHDEAPTAEATEWPQILTLYDLLQRLAPGPMVSLNRIVAVAMVHRARAGLELLAAAVASTYFEAGSSLRVDVLGHDAARYPGFRHERTINRGRYSVHTGGRYPSALIAPFVNR